MRVLFVLALLCMSQLAAAAQVCFFEDVNFKGRSMCLPAGNYYSDLSTIGWSRTISSVSIQGVAVVDFYDNTTYTGSMGRVHYSLRDLTGVNFNDRAVSVRTYVPAGRVCFFWDANYTNAYRCYLPGETVVNLAALNWNDGISSIHIDGNASAYVWQDAGYGGAKLWVQQSVPNLQGFAGWNDSISSLRVVHANGQ